jgi:YEATS domain-containing protein 4
MSTERVRVKVCISFLTPHLSHSYAFQGLSIHRPIIYGNTAVVLTPEEREVHPSREHTHRWTVAVRSAASAEDSDIVGGADDLGYFIRRVTFKLHETYPNPSRSE